MLIKFKRFLLGSKNFFSSNNIDYIFSKNTDQIILDIGTHSGFEIHDMLDLNTNIKIYAFECDLNAIKIFKKKWKKYINSGKILLTEKAITDKSGISIFYPSVSKQSKKNIESSKEEWTMSGSIKEPKGHLNKYNVKFGEPIEVITISLDEFYQTNLKDNLINFIYADVNGGERELINGGLETLNSYTKYFYTEFDDNELYKDQPNLDWITNKLKNFKLKKIINNNALFENFTLNEK